MSETCNMIGIAPQYERFLSLKGLLLMALSIAFGSAFAQDAQTELCAIIANTGNGIYAMTTTCNTNKTFSSIDIYEDNGKYVTYEDASRLRWNITTDQNKIYIQRPYNSYYVALTSSNAMSLSENSYYWNNDGNILTAQSNAKYSLQFNTSSPCFAAYNSLRGIYPSIVDASLVVDGYVHKDLTVGKIGTMCLAYNVNVADIAGAKVYSIVGKRVDGDNNPTSIVFQQETSTLVAGRPYVFVASETTLVAAYADDSKATEAGNYNGLYGTFSKCSVAEGMYLISSNTVKKCGTGCSIAANRAYINMSEVPEITSQAPARTLELCFDSNVNGIETPGITDDSAPVFGINGQRKSINTKGISIKNGKKFITK